MSLPQLNPLLGSLHYKAALNMGSVDLDGYGNIVTSHFKGVTVANPTTGVYTFTLAEPGFAILSAHPSLNNQGTPVTLSLQVASVTPSVVTLNVLNSGTPAQPSHICSLMLLMTITGSKQ